jgi:hypothetical protein
MGEGSTAASKGLAVGICCILLSACLLRRSISQ